MPTAAKSPRREVLGLPSLERHYRLAEAADLLAVSVEFLTGEVRRGAETKGRDGIYPSFSLSPKITLLPASALLTYLRRRAI